MENTTKRRVEIPHEIYMRLDDVAYEVPAHWDACTPEQKERVIEEAKHLVELINDGGSAYEGLAAYSIKRSAALFLGKISG